MAIRNIRLEGDPALRRITREVTKFDDRLAELIDDMAETMRDAPGVGLAAPQVGVNKRLVVIDIGEGIIELVNPRITLAEGQQIGQEGCLSVPGETDYVRRPMSIVVAAQDRHGAEIEIKGEEFLAVVLSHELDHLDGVLYIDRAVEPTEEEYAEMDSERTSAAIDDREEEPESEEE